MALYVFVDAYNRGNNIARRVFRDRRNPVDYMDDMELISKYRLDRASIFDLCNQLSGDLERNSFRNRALPVSLQIVVALRFYATGSFQSVIADSHGIGVQSVSRCINNVSLQLTRRIGQYIRFPNTRAAQLTTKQGFYGICGFPNVIGAVDGTFIPIKAPSEDEHLYVTRKGYHALNIQGICDANNLFFNLVVRYPGSTHDAYIWNNCAVARYLEDQRLPTTWLLGDSAYPLKTHLLTPILQPADQAERRYNTAHKKTRCVIERTYGIWKSRFRCLHKSGGHLMYRPSRSVNIVCATGVLHNICILRRIPLPDDMEDNFEDNDGADDDVDDNQYRHALNGLHVRNHLIRETFTRP